MWARRQASEIAIHRFDAEQARNLDSCFSPAFASDMIDELFGFARLHRDVHTDVRRVLRVTATDVDEHWWVAMDPSGMKASRRDLGADLTVAGTAADLYLALWNRTSGSDLDFVGDPAVLDVWRNSGRVIWSG